MGYLLRVSSSTLVLPQKATAPTTPSAPKGRFYVPALDGLRVLAFLGVWVFHTVGFLPRVQNNPVLHAIWGVGMYGVPVFFVLSAFLITRLLLMERERTGRVDLRAYYVRRTLRIWPLYFLVSAVGLVVSHRLGDPNVRGSLAALGTFTANVAMAKGRLVPNLGPLWSLSIEEQFYLVWPLALSRLSRRGLTGLCVGMIVAASVSRLGLAWHEQGYGLANAATTSHLDSLALGTLLALNLDRLRGFSRAHGGLLMVLCGLGLLLVNLTAPVYGAYSVLGRGLYAHAPWFMVAAAFYAAVPFLSAGLVALAILTRDTPLGRPRIAALGKLTFGLYMWHVIVMLAVMPHRPLAFVECLAGAFALATLTYYGVERPFLNLKHRFEKVRPRPAVSLA